jgi:hypothetical protein
MTDHALEKLNRSRRIAVSMPHFLVAPFVVANSDLIVTMESVNQFQARWQ